MDDCNPDNGTLPAVERILKEERLVPLQLGEYSSPKHVVITRDLHDMHDTRTSWWIDGIVGGLIGSVLMGMVAMILFPIFGMGSFWQPMNLIAAVFNQRWGTDGGFGVDSIVGFMVHMMMAAILGVMFAWGIRTRASGVALVGWAIVWGLVVWVVAHFVILPFIDPVMARLFLAWMFGLAHAMYGVGLGWHIAWRWSQALAEHGGHGALARMIVLVAKHRRQVPIAGSRLDAVRRPRRGPARLASGGYGERDY